MKQDNFPNCETAAIPLSYTGFRYGRNFMGRAFCKRSTGTVCFPNPGPAAKRTLRDFALPPHRHNDEGTEPISRGY